MGNKSLTNTQERDQKFPDDVNISKREGRKTIIPLYGGF